MPCPSSAVKMTRNMSGKAKMKNAEAGFRQNALFVYLTCVSVSAAPFMTCVLPAGGGPAPPPPLPVSSR